VTRHEPSLDFSAEVTLHDFEMTLTDNEATREMPTGDTLTDDDDLYVDPTPLSWMSVSGSRPRGQ
jgi:hypothetical protein